MVKRVPWNVTEALGLKDQAKASNRIACHFGTFLFLYAGHCALHARHEERQGGGYVGKSGKARPILPTPPPLGMMHERDDVLMHDVHPPWYKRSASHPILKPSCALCPSLTPKFRRMAFPTPLHRQAANCGLPWLRVHANMSVGLWACSVPSKSFDKALLYTSSQAHTHALSVILFSTNKDAFQPTPPGLDLAFCKKGHNTGRGWTPPSPCRRALEQLEVQVDGIGISVFPDQSV
eukprot:scaffold71955_cov18-Tisochrysis_lutea.AAC.1